jgi:hypothetical protein
VCIPVMFTPINKNAAEVIRRRSDVDHLFWHHRINRF